MSDKMQQQLTARFEDLVADAGPDFDESLTEFFSAEEELTYEITLPSAYKVQAPAVFAYISPKAGAAIPSAWTEIFDAYNLAWVGALNSGNDVHVARRVGMALLAPTAIQKLYSNISDQFFISGFSGGGRVASMMVPNYPDRFDGALYICGANPLMGPTEAIVSQLNNISLVFLTGTGDFNLQDTQLARATYEYAGISSTQLMIVNELEHALPGAPVLREALTGLMDKQPGPEGP